MRHLIKKILNEFDENDFSWAEDAINEKNIPVSYETVKPGDKVIRGKDWYYGSQDEGAEYGRVRQGYSNSVEGKPYLSFEDDDDRFIGYWVMVEWVDRNGKEVYSNTYRVGPKRFDLNYY